MDIASELLARYTSFLATAPSWTTNGYSQRMQVCMALERVAGDMMDQAPPKKREEVCSIYRQIIVQTLAAGRGSTGDA